MKLFFAPGACSLSPHIALREAGIDFELERVDSKTGRTASGAVYKEINPKGYIPALQLDNGEVLTEGPAIVQYIADLAPNRDLAPVSGSFSRARLQEWLNFICSELHKSFSLLFRPTPQETKQVVRAQLSRWFAWLNDELAQRPYLMDDGFTVADGYLFVILRWGAFVELPLDPWPHLQAFQARIRERPAVQAALKAEGLAG
jgi:glutathione S-transferase